VKQRALLSRQALEVLVVNLLVLCAVYAISERKIAVVDLLMGNKLK
jgi:hypothetical protein